MMEINGKLARVDGGWVYSCDMFRAFGDTPENAYAAWLAGFEYRGPALPYAGKLEGDSDAAIHHR